MQLITSEADKLATFLVLEAERRGLDLNLDDADQIIEDEIRFVSDKIEEGDVSLKQIAVWLIDMSEDDLPEKG